MLLTLVLAASCGGSKPPDTNLVPLAEGKAGDQTWRLEGQRLGGQLCVSLVLPSIDRPPAGRCGIRRTPLRHLDPVTVMVGSRRVVFSPLPRPTQRVRIDGGDGAIRIEPARSAAGFPARFFVVDLDRNDNPMAVRAFGRGGRAVVT